MADESDLASEQERLAMESARIVQAKRAASEPKLVATGECLNILCGEPVSPVTMPGGTTAMPLFCNNKCAAIHARMK